MSAARAARVSSLLLCLVAVSLQITITEFNVPSQAEVGTNVKLSCQYRLDEGDPKAEVFVKWWRTPLNAESDKKKQIYQHMSGKDPQSIHIHPDEIEIQDADTIVLLKVDAMDSGTYECEIDNLNETRRHQELIVYTPGSGPQLNFSVIDEGPEAAEEAGGEQQRGVLVTCAASGVAPEPELVITVADKAVNIEELTYKLDDVLYDISANYTLNKSEAEGANVRCELTFRNFNFSHPEYIDEKMYDPTGHRAPTTATNADDAATDAPAKSLQNTPDGTSRQDISWALLFSLALPIHLLTLL